METTMFAENDSARWYVISTKAKRESFAQDQLARRGVTTFLPRIAETTYRTEQPAIVPLFPGYLFLEIDIEQQFFDVVWTPGVKRFVGFGLSPTPLDRQVVDFLMDRGGRDGVIRIHRPFTTGEVVRIRRGPMAGLVGIVDRPVAARGRVRVLMELLRRQTRVELPDSLVERVTA